MFCSYEIGYKTLYIGKLHILAYKLYQNHRLHKIVIVFNIYKTVYFFTLKKIDRERLKTIGFLSISISIVFYKFISFSIVNLARLSDHN